MLRHEVEKTFLESYDAYADAIFRHCYVRVSDRETAKDLAQETFTRTWQYLAAGENVQNIRAFLYRVANNLIIDRSRRKRPLRLEELGEDGWEPSEDPRPMINLGIDAAAIRRVIIRLKPEHRDVITFRFVEDLGPKEIAAITGETENTVSVRLHRAIASLRQLIAEKGTKFADPV